MKMYLLNPFVKWYTELNCWKFPDQFKSLKPANWESMTYRDRQSNIPFKSLIKICLFLSNEKQRFNYWHCVKLKRSQEQFEDWWTNREPLHG